MNRDSDHTRSLGGALTLFRQVLKHLHCRFHCRYRVERDAPRSFSVRWRSCSACALALLFFACTSPLLAQFSSSISGTVEDPSGAVIPGAAVTLTNVDTNVGRSAVSSGNGAYIFSQLPPGTYRIKVTAANFQDTTLNNVVVAGAGSRTADVKLTPGSAATTVTVNADTSAALQRDDAAIQGVVDNQQIQRVPSYGRDPYEQLRTMPGIAGDGSRNGAGDSNFLPNNVGAGGSNSGIYATENQVQITASGHRVTANNYLLDGVSVNSLGYGGAAVITPNPEAVGSITVISTSFSAEDGRNSGAQIKTITKSGTNDIHGTANFVYDEPGLNAFARYPGPDGGLNQRVQNKQREYAASLGGPIIKNKLFFFASYEGFKQSSNTYIQQWGETASYRTMTAAARPNSIANSILTSPGITPRVVTVLPPPGGCAIYANNPQFAGLDISKICQVVGNGIDVGSPTLGKGQYVDQTNYAGGGLDGIADLEYDQFLYPRHSRGNQWNGRIDWNATSKDLLAGVVYFTKFDQTSGFGGSGFRPQADTPVKPLSSEATLIYIHTFNATLQNELRGNYTRFHDDSLADAAGTVNYNLPFTQIQNIPTTNQIGFGAQAANTTPSILAQNQYEFRDTVTKTIGSNTLILGGAFRWEQDNNNLFGSNRPTYTFQGLWNFANDTPEYEGIFANPETGGPAITQRYFRSQNFAAFAQDNWRPTPNLTLNAGLRWEFFGPPNNRDFPVNLPYFSSTPGREIIDTGVRPVNHFYQPQYANFSPKLGFAYSPSRYNGKVVVRGGFALAYDRLDFNLFENAAEDGPGYANFGICCAAPGNTTVNGTLQYKVGTGNTPNGYGVNPGLKTGINPATGLPLPLPNANGLVVINPVEVYGVSNTAQTPYSYLYTLGTQFEMPYGMVGTVSYVGSTGHAYPRFVNQNFIYPTCTVPTVANNVCPPSGQQTPYSQAFIVQTDSYSSFNSALLHLTKRMSHGLQLDADYAYAKSLDQVSNGDYADGSANQTYPVDNRTEYGPSDYDIRHRITVTGLWQLPGYHNGAGLLGEVLSGWQLNGIYTFHTGFPWTPVVSRLDTNGPVSSPATIATVRPQAYFGGAHNSCSTDAWKSGGNFPNGGTTYFDTSNINSPVLIPPGIGRNSFNGPCYSDADMSAAKQITIKAADRDIVVRFQANSYNTFNKLNLLPIGFNTAASQITSPDFGKSSGASAGRVIEFVGRIQF